MLNSKLQYFINLMLCNLKFNLKLNTIGKSQNNYLIHPRALNSIELKKTLLQQKYSLYSTTIYDDKFIADSSFSGFTKPNLQFCNIIESTKHYFFHYSNFENERQSLLQNFGIVNPNLLSMNEDVLAHLLLYGDKLYRITQIPFFKFCH